MGVRTLCRVPGACAGRRCRRPEIGGRVTPALGDGRLRQIGDWAAGKEISRADAIRRLIDAGLDAEQEQDAELLAIEKPYIVTELDISTRNREIISRHGSLGAAVVALREAQADDNVNDGLPSTQPRVEHDGRPVDVEEYE